MKNDELTKAVISQELMDLQRMADASYDILVAKAQNNQIPEPVFRHHFLNYFTGQGEANENRNVMAEWVAVAGSATASVDVFDEKTRQVLFTVPAIMNTNNIHVTDAKGKSLMELKHDHALAARSFPGAGNRFAKTVMVDKAVMIAGERPDMSLAEKQWRQMSQYYGIGVGGSIVEAETKVIDTGDLYDFD